MNIVIVESYISESNKAIIMEELLYRLEQQIKNLVDQYDQLKRSNQQLHHGKFLLVREKESLVAKQYKAISQIQNLVSKLKAIERDNNDGKNS